MNQSWMMPSAVFILAIVLQAKFLRNLGSMPKTFKHVLSTSGKHTTGFLVKCYGERCGSTVLTTACYWLSSHCSPAQKLVSASGKLNHECSPLVLDSDKDVCCHYCSLHSLHQWLVCQTMARGPHPAHRTDQSDPLNILQIFFKCHISNCRQQCNSINCCLSRKSHCIRHSSGEAIANSALGSKRLATPAGE